MERIKELGRYQKGLLLVLIAMVLIFTVVYSIFASQVGFVYKDAFMEKSTEGENTLYTGKIKGKTAVFTVGEDRSVTYRYGDKTYGPYTAKKDPFAVPNNTANASLMTGVEIREGEKVFFRGGVMVTDPDDLYMMIYDENGMFYSGITVSSEGVMYDENGRVIDPNVPTVNTILRMMSGVKLTKRGNWQLWLTGVFLSVLIAVAILFAEELFRLRLSFLVRNADLTEPTDWELLCRNIGWTVAAFATLFLFISGLII